MLQSGWNTKLIHREWSLYLPMPMPASDRLSYKRLLASSPYWHILVLERLIVMKPTTKSFIIGLCLGALLPLGIYGIYRITHLPPLFSPTIVYYDDQARAAIIRYGFALTPSITDCYFYVDGFSARDIFLAFSGPQAKLDKIVETKTGKKIGELAAWKDQIDRDDFMFSPGTIDAKYRTMFYDPSRVKHGVFFQANHASSEADHWHIIYDRDGDRVYFNENW